MAYNMAFTMTHLIIADNINTIYADNICDLPQFFLGSIAPDAIHNRAGYVSDFKKNSHLCTGNEKWGMLTNNEENTDNAIEFLRENINSKDRDFIIGYCTHILTDIYNNIALWTPFRERYSYDLDKGYGSLYHNENNLIDIHLALTHEKIGMFWRYLTESRGVDLPDYIYAAEIEAQKDKILNIWYRGKELPDLSSNTFITYDVVMDLIEKATDYTARHLSKALFL